VKRQKAPLPKIFMIENVKGLLTHDNGKTIQTIIEALNTNNLYNIQYRCLDASKYDVPQKRERVFIVGVLHSITRSFVYPTESSIKPVLKDVLYDVPFSNGAKYNEDKKKLFTPLTIYTREHLKSDNPPSVDCLSIDLRVTLPLNTEPDTRRASGL
jgi:site-specific DNA-cytosine methylase